MTGGATRAGRFQSLGVLKMRGFLIVCAGFAMAAPAMAARADLGTILRGPAGENLGWVSVDEGPRGVVVKVEVKGLTPGWHGLHLHEKSACAGPDFKSAGSHVHGEATAIHGLLNADGNEPGDMPNIYVAADGSGAAEVYVPGVSLNGAPGRKDINRASLVIHANADDHRSQPIGGAGARVACAEFGPPALMPAKPKG
jgi:superoxide dismutase, Cu-Zn family